MRDIADKFVGGIEQIDARLPGARAGLSLRAVALGFAGVAMLSVFEPYNQSVFENTMLIGNQLPVGVLFLVLLFVLVVNPVLTDLPHAASPFDPARLTILWVCLLPASLVAWRGPIVPGAREVPQGFAGSVVVLAFILTGVLLAGAAALGHYHRRHAFGVSASAATPMLSSAAWRAMPRLVIACLCFAPVLLTPVLSRGLDDYAASIQRPAILAVKYAALTLALYALSFLVMRLLKRVPPFAPAELAVMATMMLCACGVIWSGFHRLWAHQLVAPFYHLQTHPRWGPLVGQLPSWLVPSNDPRNVDVVYNFYAGDSDVPWGPWCAVAVRWAPFLLAFFIGVFFLMALFRRQWVEAEKLPFPLATIALETLRPPPPGRLLNDVLRSRLFWWSVAVVMAFQTLYALHVYFPAFPEIVFKYDLHAALEMPPWRHLPHHIRAKDAFFAVVGVAFFLSTEMSFSLWAFALIMGLVEMIGRNFQYPIQDHFPDHQIGGYVAYGAVIIWVARRHLARAFRSIWRRPPANDTDTHLSERSAAIGFILCFAVAAIWLTCAGLPGHVAGLVTLVIFLLALVVGRIIAESGLLFAQYQCWPHVFAESTFPQLLTPQTHALIHFSTIAPTMDAREAVMPYAANATRIADGSQHITSRRRLFALWIASLVLALVLAGAAQLKIVYHRGANLTDEFAAKILPEMDYNRSADFADLLAQPPDKIRATHAQHASRVATGAGVTLALCFLRYRFLAWPLHPIGFIMAYTYPMQVFWLSIMIGWLCKTLVMRLGGVPVYRKLSPIFLGMIVGTTFSSVFWIAVKIASFTAGQTGLKIIFLPS